MRLILIALVILFFNILNASADTFPKIIDETALKDGTSGRGNVDPCDDFYHFACGTWIDNTVIPADKRAVYRQSTPLDESTDINLNKILTAYSQNDFTIPAKYSDKLGKLYTSCMTADQNTATSLLYVKNQIAKLTVSTNVKERTALIAKLNQLGTGAFFNFYSAQSLNDSTAVIGDFSQGGFALGDRDYYFQTDSKAVEIRQKYQEHIAAMFGLIGFNKTAAAQVAAKILKLETTLASKAYIDADAGDPSKTNHPMNRAGLQKLMPHFDFNTYFLDLGVPQLQTFNVDEPEFFQNLDKVMTSLNQVDFKNYLTWLVLNEVSTSMGGAFEQAHFDFWSAYLNGSKQMSPRWKICTRAIESSMGYALAEAYVKTFDGEAIKQKTSSLIALIKSTFAQELHDLVTGPDAWLDNDTIKEALNKIDLMTQKVGAPEVWRNYDSLQIVANNYLSNSLQLTRFEINRDLNKIGKPVDKTEWGMMPWEVNAYYDRSNNEFVFPFGILQPPSLDMTASDGANLGAFGGGTIGHELSHGFDNNGSQYDSHGNLKNWWTPKTKALFQQKSQCYVNQANAYTIQEVGLNVDGAQTLEENLADQGGVKFGYLALESELKTRPEAPVWNGKYNERQQYWIAYAQSWCAKTTPEALRSQMTTDPHPPSEFRVNAVLMNMRQFAQDFNCPVGGSRMAPANQCTLW
ncbi:MAG: M13 family metallopeptidase [Pseudobdellovibrio sp.]